MGIIGIDVIFMFIQCQDSEAKVLINIWAFQAKLEYISINVLTDFTIYDQIQLKKNLTTVQKKG